MKSRSLRGAGVTALLIAATGLAAPASAQTWPAKPIRLVVGFAPGGTTDLMSRMLGDRMSQALGQPIVIENRPGAGGVIGMDAVIKADPDGYTFGLIPSPTLIAAIFNGREQNTDRDFTPVGLTYRQGVGLGINRTMPEFKDVKNASDLVRVIKANPNRIFFGSIGTGSSGHLIGELMKISAGLQWTHIPYKGQSVAFQEVMSGQSPIVMIGISLDNPKAYGERLVAIGVSSIRRNPRLPDVPTLAESGFPGMDATSWGGYAAPAGLPPAIRERLIREYKAAFDSAEFQSKWAHFILDYIAPPEFGILMRETVQIWSRVIRDNNIKPN